MTISVSPFTPINLVAMHGATASAIVSQRTGQGLVPEKLKKQFHLGSAMYPPVLKLSLLDTPPFKDVVVPLTSQISSGIVHCHV